MYSLFVYYDQSSLSNCAVLSNNHIIWGKEDWINVVPSQPLESQIASSSRTVGENNDTGVTGKERTRHALLQMNFLCLQHQLLWFSVKPWQLKKRDYMFKDLSIRHRSRNYDRTIVARKYCHLSGKDGWKVEKMYSDVLGLDQHVRNLRNSPSKYNLKTRRMVMAKS